MMRTIITAFVLLFGITFCSAQTITSGIRAAVNISNLDFEPDSTGDNFHRNGFAFAGFVDFGFSEKVALRTELQWSAEGGKADALRADYIKLPVLLRVNVYKDLSLLAGPQVAVKTWKDADNFTTFTFAGVGGLEYMLTEDFFIDARYYYGFSNILDEDLIQGVEAKNHVIQFGIGFKI